MTGLELSEEFFFIEGLPALKQKFPDIEEKAAFGLCGEGSDCFGYDDEISRDHDWGPGFCVWMEKPVFDLFGEEAEEVYRSLPGSWKGFKTRLAEKNKRTGIFEISSFYKRLTGLEEVPGTNLQWWGIRDFNLAAATNGRIFIDKPGSFSKFRDGLMRLPDEVRVKRIAEYLLKAGQSGQYNYYRALKRGDRPAAMIALSRFSEFAMKMIYCLNSKYPPYYKWLYRGLKELELLGKELRPIFYALGTETDSGDAVERISRRIIITIREQGLSDSDSDFLPDHIQSLHERISDRELALLNLTP